MLRRAPAALLVAALWLLVHPWLGLWHDGRLYAVQALRRLQPENFQRDLFFLYGSQDAFTLFSPLYAAAIGAFGLEPAALLLQGLGSALWLGAAAWLLAAFLRGYPFWLGLALLASLPSDYGPIKGLFFLAESFPTPRLFAEACSMLALAGALRGQYWRAGAALLLALLLHPLMAAGAALFGLLFLAQGRARALAAWALGGAALLLGLAVAGVAPFSRLLLSMDAEWWDAVAQLVPAVAWDRWQWGECASRWTLAFALVLAGAVLAGGWRARFFGCAAATGALALLASWLGTGLTHNLLLVQIQPWRAMWLLLLASWIALAWLLAEFWPRGRIFRVLLLALGAAVLTRNSYGGWLALGAAAALCQQARSAAPLQLSGRHYGLALAVVAALAAGWLATSLDNGIGSGIYLVDIPLASLDTLWAWTLLRQGGASVLGAGALWLAWRWLGAGGRAPERHAAEAHAAGPHGAGRRAADDRGCGRQAAAWRGAAAWALALGAVAGAALLFGASAERSALLPPASQRALQAAFQPLLPRGATVYWQHDVRYTWFVLQRASYASAPQLGGAAFNRGTALEGQRRLQRLLPLGGRDSVRGRDRADTLLRTAALPVASPAALRQLCADPALDFVVLEQFFSAGRVAHFADRAAEQEYHLYQCALLRGAAP